MPTDTPDYGIDIYGGLYQTVEESTRIKIINIALADLAAIGIRGLTAADFSKLVPDDDMTPALEIMAEVRAYFQGKK